MPAIGITGGISTGKSTFVECLRELFPAATFFDADQAAHALLNRPEIQKQIRREFGARLISTPGDLNRAKLRTIVFAANGGQRRKSIAILPDFSLLIFHFFMRPEVKACAIEWLWWPLRKSCSWPGDENGGRSGAPTLNK